MMVMKVDESLFFLKKLTRLGGDGLHLEYESQVIEESTTFTNNEKSNFTVPPHEDLLTKVRALNPFLCEIFGFEDTYKIVKHPDFKASKPQIDKAQKSYINKCSEVEITGFSISGFSDKRTVIISGKFTIQKLGTIAIQTPKIKLSNNLFGWEEEVEKLIDDLQHETYEYLFNAKRDQMKIAFDQNTPDE
jgi:hypothetical protein